jgi:hypothetical protein
MIRKFFIHLLGGSTAQEVEDQIFRAQQCTEFDLRKELDRSAAKRSARELVDFLTLVSEINDSTLVTWTEVEDVMYEVNWYGNPIDYVNTKKGTLGEFLSESQGTHYNQAGIELWVESNLHPIEFVIGAKTFVLAGKPNKLVLTPKV